MKYSLNKLLFTISIAITIIFFLSLNCNFFDFFLIGTRHGYIGYDFFAVPRSFLNLQIGKSIYTYMVLPYGPYAAWYPYHPALSILIGLPLSFFKPWVSYWIFVSFSILILYYCAFKLSSLFRNLHFKNITYIFLLASFPTYLMLWNAQMHIFLVLSITLILIYYIETIFDNKSSKINSLLYTGIFISLFSKPLIFIILPVILINPDTRKIGIISLIIYCIISFVFLFNNFLSPNSDNFTHWVNIFNQTLEIGYNREYFSLPSLLNNTYSLNIYLNLYKIPLLLPILFSISLFFIKERQIKNEISLILIIVTIYSYFLSYNVIWEYHYTILLPIIPIFLFLILKEKQALVKKTYQIIFILSLTIYLPTTYFLFKINIINDFTFSYQLIRVVPVFLIYILLNFILILKFKNMNKIVIH